MTQTPFDIAQVDRLLTTTRAVRRRLDLERAVDPALVRECLQVALQAPTGLDAQEWRWVVVEDEDQRRAVAEQFAQAADGYIGAALDEARAANDAKMVRLYESVLSLADNLSRVPVLVVPCMVSRLPDNAPHALATSHFGSIYPAVWSFQLALHSRGLGSVLTTVHLIREKECAQILGIPEGVAQVCLLPVAHIRGGDLRAAPRRKLDELLSIDRWGTRSGAQ